MAEKPRAQVNPLLEGLDDAAMTGTFEIAQETANLDAHHNDDKVPDNWNNFPFSALRENEVIEAECALRLKMFQKLKKKSQKQISEAQDWGEKTEIIQKLNARWRELTPQMFVACVMSLGQDSDDFCESLSMRMHTEDWDVKDRKTHLAESLRHMRREPAGDLLITFADWTEELGDPPKGRQYTTPGLRNRKASEKRSSLPAVEEDAPRNSVMQSFMPRWTRMSLVSRAGSASTPLSVTLPSEQFHPWGKTKVKSSWDKLFRSEKAEYNVFWTAVSHLVDPETTRDQLHIVKALADTGSNSHVYNTVIGRVIQEHAWKRVKSHFFVNVILEGLYLLCMGLLGYTAHRQERPTRFLAIFTLTLTFYNVVGKNFMQFFLTMRLFGRAGFSKFLSGWNIFTTVLNVFASLVTVRACWPSLHSSLDPCLDVFQNVTGVFRNQCYMQRHPVFFAFSTFFKWLEFIISLLCVRSLGLGLIVTPAFHAVTHKESVFFLLASGLLVLGSWHAYWTFPIPENRDDAAYMAGIPLFAFIKVFRLVLLADFDTYELEGLDPELKGTMSAINVSKSAQDLLEANVTDPKAWPGAHDEVFGLKGSVEDGTLDPRIHWGIQLFFLMSVIMGVIVMNVYIGLLGNLYDEGKRARQQLHQHLKAEYTYKLLLYKEFCPWLPCYWSKHGGPFSACSRAVEGNLGQVGNDVAATRPSVRPVKSDDVVGDAVRVVGEVMDGCWIAYDDRSFMDREDVDVRIRQIEESLEEVKDLATMRDSQLNAKMDALLAHLKVDFQPPRPETRRQTTVRF